MRVIFLIFLMFVVVSSISVSAYDADEQEEAENFLRLEHPLNHKLFTHLKTCDSDKVYCEENFHNITNLFAKIANEHTALLLVDRAKRIFEDILYFTGAHTKLGQRAVQILVALSFGQGNVQEAEKYWTQLNPNDLMSQRSRAAQIVMSGSEAEGIAAMMGYSSMLGQRFYGFVNYPKDMIHKQSKNGAFSIGNFLTEDVTQSYSNDSSSANNSNNSNSSNSGNDSALSDLNNTTATITNTTSSDTNDTNNINDTTIRPIIITTPTVTLPSVHIHSPYDPLIIRAPSTPKSEDFFLDFLLSESQGGIKNTIKMSDMQLATSDIRPLDAKQRFRLGVGLAKVGLYDLSLKHVWLAATPWEAPLYRLRAQLTFSPVHTSVRALAAAVDSFERQGEVILNNKALFNSPVMRKICNRLDDAVLALQSLPLLHMAGFASPRFHTALGYSSVSLPVLLSEIYTHMCPPDPVHAFLTAQLQSQQHVDAGSGTAGDTGGVTGASVASSKRDKSPASRAASASASDMKEKSARTFESMSHELTTNRKFRIGFMSGNYDGDIGRIMIGLIESMSPELRKDFELTGMCFPTPRDATTDKLLAMFDSNINLSAANKTEAMERIAEAKLDFLLFADVALDSRVFAMAHERLALHQGILWGYGGTMGIPTIDFYFMPEIFWAHSKCAAPLKRDRAADSLGISKPAPVRVNRAAAIKIHTNNLDKPVAKTEAELKAIRESESKVAPQQLYKEQVVLLEGLPNIPRPAEISIKDVSSILQNRYLLLLGNRTHLYIVPCGVKHLHPEFDGVIEKIVKTDPYAIIMVVLPRVGRDGVPATHFAIRYDLMHPSMSAALVHKFMQRMKVLLNNDEAMLDRVRVLPPLEGPTFRALVQTAVAVLDPFPVGLHLPILEAIYDRVPVISSYKLQECTNSHAVNMLTSIQSLADVSSGRVRNDSVHAQQGQRHSGDLSLDVHPNNAEEYGVLAITLNRDARRRLKYVVNSKSDLSKLVAKSKSGPLTHGNQMLKFFTTLRNSL